LSESQKEQLLHGLEKWEQPEPTDKHESKFHERREHLRINASVYAICETKNANFRDFTRNVSAGGVLIEPEATLYCNEDIFMTLFHKNFNHPVRTNGKVVRVDINGAGVQFNQVIPGMSSV
jgi:c-di-GMP-binding flagellar brake protein YcgR